jgi:hypothetical protein
MTLMDDRPITTDLAPWEPDIDVDDLPALTPLHVLEEQRALLQQQRLRDVTDLLHLSDDDPYCTPGRTVYLSGPYVITEGGRVTASTSYMWMLLLGVVVAVALIAIGAWA